LVISLNVCFGDFFYYGNQTVTDNGPVLKNDDVQK
jgi:hypothetical protein